jgi:hypothetical protein
VFVAGVPLGDGVGEGVCVAGGAVAVGSGVGVGGCGVWVGRITVAVGAAAGAVAVGGMLVAATVAVITRGAGSTRTLHWEICVRPPPLNLTSTR